MTTDHEVNALKFANRSLYCLRQIRGSAFEFIARPLDPVEPTEAMIDAETVGVLAASFVLDFKQTDDTTTLSDQLSTVEQKYKNYRDFAVYPHTARINLEHNLSSKLHVFEYLAAAPSPEQYMSLWRSLIGMDNTTQMPDLDIFNPKLGIVAPLSSDYLYAVIMQKFIQKHTKLPFFQLKPLVLSPSLDWDINPGEGQQDIEFQNSVDEMAVWTNLDESFRTRIGTSKAVERMYPGKPIHGAIFA